MLLRIQQQLRCGLATSSRLVVSLLLVLALCAADQRAESETFEPTPAAWSSSTTRSSSSPSASSQPLNMRALREHPAVFTLGDLGLWSTELMGNVPLAAAVAAAVSVVQRHPVPAAVIKVTSAVSATLAAAADSVPHPGSTTVLLRHWWRLRCSADEQQHQHGEGSMDLRGLGQATSAADWVFHHALTSYVPTSTAALNITDAATASTWTLPQSDVVPGIPSGWHVEARGLSPAASYSLSSASGLSQHSHGVDASRCSRTPPVFKAGSMWSVITASEPYQDPDLYAQLVAQHTSYHQALGFTGAILFVTRPIAAQLLQHPALAPGLRQGAYVIMLWDGDAVPGTPYYHQALLHNLVLLATWGVPNMRLAFIDLDEFYVLPGHASFQEAFADSGCMAGLVQARVMRMSAYAGITAAEARACPDSAKHHAACQPQRGRVGDVVALAALGWRRFFSQASQYVDARYTIPESTRLRHRWAHKSFVDPNHVAAYGIHEAGVILPGGGVDSQAGLPLQCVFGLHLVNMLSPRMYGEGEALAINGTTFDMPTYVASLTTRRLYADLVYERVKPARAAIAEL